MAYVADQARSLSTKKPTWIFHQSDTVGVMVEDKIARREATSKIRLPEYSDEVICNGSPVNKKAQGFM